MPRSKSKGGQTLMMAGKAARSVDRRHDRWLKPAIIFLLHALIFLYVLSDFPLSTMILFVGGSPVLTAARLRAADRDLVKGVTATCVNADCWSVSY